MKLCTFTINGVAPYGQTQMVGEKKTSDETHDQFEKRIWTERAHVTDDGTVFIPPTALKKSIESAAGWLGITIPGKGKSTYKKRFASGILVPDPVLTNAKKSDLQPKEMFLDAQGRKGGGTRVFRCYPILTQWEAYARVIVMDNVITQEIFEQHLDAAGKFVGLGWFRVENGGYYGRFTYSDLTWEAMK